VSGETYDFPLPDVPLVAVAFHPGQAFAQDMLPAPADQTERDACKKEFAPLRAEADERGKLIKVASERHAPPGEALQVASELRSFRNQYDAVSELSPQKETTPAHGQDGAGVVSGERHGFSATPTFDSQPITFGGPPLFNIAHCPNFLGGLSCTGLLQA
jgi:hypothetical protein